MKFKVFAAILLLCMLTGAAALADAQFTSGNWRYTPTGDGSVILTGYSGRDARVTVPAEVDGKKVSGMDEGLFARNNGIETVVISEGIKAIHGENCFYFCGNLKSVTLPDSLTDYGDGNPFSDCMALEEIIVSESHPTLYVDESGVLFDGKSGALVCYPPARTAERYAVPEGTAIIDARAFSCCAYLTEIILPEGLREVRSQAFYSCIQLESMIIPEGVTLLEDAFSCCLNLKEVTLPNSLSVLEANPFPDCSHLEQVHISDGHPNLGFANGAIYDKTAMQLLYALPAAIPGDYEVADGMRSIAPKAFMGCQGMDDVVLPEGLAEIGAYAFYDTEITGLELPASLEKIGNGAFASCNYLKKIEIAEDNAAYYAEDGVLFSRGDKRLVCYPAGKRDKVYAIPSGTKIIGVGAFQANTYLTGVTIPEGVTAIEAAAFNNCKALMGVMMPDSLAEIGDSAFASSGISVAKLSDGLKKVGLNVFAGCAEGFHVIVDANSNAQQYAEVVKLDYIHPDRMDEMASGDRGGSVALLQQRLIALGLLQADADGIYGGMTEAAVKDFQQSIGMAEPTGKADSATLAALFA